LAIDLGSWLRADTYRKYRAALAAIRDPIGGIGIA
jgi:hypothetical protein